MFSALSSKSNSGTGLGSTSPTGSTARTKRLPFKKRLIKLLGRMTFRFLWAGSALLCPWSVRVIGNSLGTAYYRASRRYRTVALNNLKMVYPEQSPAEREAIARAVFTHFAREALEFFRVLKLSRKRVDESVELAGAENMDRALALGKGCIAVTAHYGNWEMLARKVVIAGYKLNVIARDSDDPGMTGIATAVRESGGYRVFDKDQPIIGAFRSLKRNEMLAILPDQNDSDGVAVDFFGRKALTATGPAVLSLKSGAPIVPAFCRSLGSGQYRAQVYPAIEYEPTGDEEADILEITRLINVAMEAEIRSNPSQWLWLHNRWKHLPEANNAAD